MRGKVNLQLESIERKIRARLAEQVSTYNVLL